MARISPDFIETSPGKSLTVSVRKSRIGCDESRIAWDLSRTGQQLADEIASVRGLSLMLDDRSLMFLEN